MRFKDLRPEEAGEWRCRLEEYYDGYGTNKGKGAKDEKSFFIDVEAKGASICKARARYIVMDFESS